MIVRSKKAGGWAALLFAVAAVVLCACGGSRDLDLFRLASAEAVHRDDHEVLRIHGDSLPLGREALVTWSGTLHRSGLAPRMVNARTRGRVIATDLVEVPMSEESLRAFYGGGTFHGNVRVAFDARMGAAAITGSLDDVRVWIRTARVESLSENLTRARRAGELAHFFGLEMSEYDVVGGGARVERVGADGVASRAGVRAGDIVTEVDGAFVEDAKDVLPEPNADRIAMRLRRVDEVAPVDVLLSLGGFENQPPREDLMLGAFLVLFVAITSILLAPRAFAPDGVVARFDSLLRGVRGSSVAGFTLASVAIAALMMLSLRRIPAAGHVWTWIVAATVAYLSGKFASRRAWRDRARYREVSMLALGVLSLVVVALLVGTGSIPAFGSLQSDRVWTWIAFKQPGTALLAWVAFETLLVGDASDQEDSSELPPSAFAAWVAFVCRAIFVSLVVVMFFGGLHSPDVLALGVRWVAVVSAVTFATKVAVLAAASALFRNTVRTRARVLLVGVLLAGVAFAVSHALPHTGVGDTLTANLTAFLVGVMLTGWGVRTVLRNRARAKVREAAPVIAVELPSDAASSTA